MAFCILPIEYVANYLTDDRDLCNFALTCQSTYAAVNTDGSGIWRQRFASTYDQMPGQSSNDLKRKYQRWRRVLRKGAIFSFGHEAQERRCLEILRELIIESYGEASSTCEDFQTSLNIVELESFMRRTNLVHDLFLNGGFRTGIGSDQLFLTVQLLFAHCSLNLAFNAISYAGDLSQKAVYEDNKMEPIFLGKSQGEVNVEWLLHVVNFFKYHMTCKEICTLLPIYEDLEDKEKPKAWKKKLERGVKKLGKSWKGSYGKETRADLYTLKTWIDAECYDYHVAYLDIRDLDNIRRNDAGKGFYMDNIDVDGGFQTMQLDFSTKASTPWPDSFERHLHSIPTLTKIQGRSTTPSSLRFEASGYDRESFFGSGSIHELPPQHGIPGWQRLTLMKYFADEQGAYEAGSDWCYEGCVLPGGQIILGRWWRPEMDPRDDTAYCGPFIFWNVADDEEEQQLVGSEAGDDDGAFVPYADDEVW
ncbi:MAG: hypothetical protein M1827_003255 [Pycnora praestabilis]|nr:MAG: hypothetical protein M1827_003255 [Pycnora praestabilis]